MTPEEKTAYRLRFHRFQQSREKYFAPLINKALKEQYKTFVKHIGEGLEPALNKIDAGDVYIVIKALYVDAGTVYGAKIRSDLNRLKARMPIGFSEMMRQLILDYFQTDILNTSQGITEKTKDLIREVFSNAYEIGLGIDDIVKQLEGTELSRIRARTIARSETVTASNKGAEFVAKQTGLKMLKEWLATTDNRTRHSHIHINGVTVPFEDYFNVNGNQMAVPGDRGGTDGRLPTDAAETINCRCTALFIPIRENGKLVRVS